MENVIPKRNRFDFKDGQGPVPAHKHLNGGGWVADTATVDETAYVGQYATVHGYASVRDWACVDDQADISGYCTIKDLACIRGRAILKGACEISDHAEISGNVFLAGYIKIGQYKVLAGHQCYFDIADCLSCPALLDDNYTASHANPCFDCMAKLDCHKKRQSLGELAIGSWLKQKWTESYKVRKKA